MSRWTDLLLSPSYCVDVRMTLPRHATKRWGTRDPEKIVGVVYHQSLGSLTAAGTAAYHVGPNHISADGLPGLSYTAFVEPDGRVMIANDVEAKTYSQGDGTRAGDENAVYMGVCFGGNFHAPGYTGEHEPTCAQLTAALNFWEHCRETFGLSNGDLHGHYDFGKPTCPGNTLEHIIEIINQDKHQLFQDIEDRQRFLAEIGLYDGAIDGDWGRMSRVALITFQRRSGLIADGVWGKKTTAAAIKARP
jgi:hypothetical protein